MKKSINNLKLLIRAGQGKIPSDLAIRGGSLVNVMTGEIYPADVAVYRDTIVAVGDISGYVDDKTEIIDAGGAYLVPGLIDGHIHVECSKLSVSGYASVVVPHGTTAMISGLDEYISVSGLEGLKEIFAEINNQLDRY
jgi:adenine deaminase